MKKKFTLDNYDNNKTLDIELSDVPRSGDWIKIEDQDFTEGEDYMKVKCVIFDPLDEVIFLIVQPI
jgi:hypothetical protein